MNSKIRYAVVGLGWIAQETVLPSFINAENAQLTALVSDDEIKLKELGDKYNIDEASRYTYKEYSKCLKSGNIDAVYIALPNAMHCEYSIKAAKAGIHILCEKPMAMNAKECKRMMEAARANNVKLMIAYRLHFDEGNLKAIDIANSGKLGDQRFFTSTYSMQVKDDNIRLDPKLTGGPLYDIGIYCINAVRGIFKAEPTEVVAFSHRGKDPRFTEVDEMVTALMRFSDQRLATFTCSFGAGPISVYEVVGTQGSLEVDPAFGHNKKVAYTLKTKAGPSQESFEAHDQFGPELVYFSDCILNNKDLEPSGLEGLADVRVIEALNESARKNKPIALKPLEKLQRPDPDQIISRPKQPEPDLIHAQGPTQK